MSGEDLAIDLGAIAAQQGPYVSPLPTDQSGSIAELSAALAKAQGAMENASKDSRNPHFGSKYADLAATWDAVRKPLSENGLAVMQRVRPSAAGVCIITHLTHSSGQWVKDSMDWPVAQRTPQGIGSAITYGKRYALQALLGVASEDDDGNAASGKVAPRGADAVKDALKAVNSPTLLKQLEDSVADAKSARRRREAPSSLPVAARPVEPLQDPGIASRASALWKKAKETMDPIGFQGFVTTHLGTNKKSSTWSEDDIARLEVAWQSEEGR